MIAEHYHITCMRTPHKYARMAEVIVEKTDKGWDVRDCYGDITAVDDAILGTFNTLDGALRFAIMQLRKVYPQSIFLSGAGYPADWGRYEEEFNVGRKVIE